MISKIKNIFRKNIKDDNLLELKERKINLELNTIFYVMRYGNEIGLKIDNKDSCDALMRELKLKGIMVRISEWADWTISVTLFDDNERLEVAESIVPSSSIHWNSDKSFVTGYSNLKWLQEGIWQEEITKKFNKLKEKIENEKKVKLEEEKRLKDEEEMIKEKIILKKKNHFEKVYRNKLNY